MELSGLSYGSRHELDGQPERGEEGGEHGRRLRGQLLAGEREPGAAAAAAAADASLVELVEALGATVVGSDV